MGTVIVGGVIEKDGKFLLVQEAKERDHRKIGKELDLFCFSDYVGGGLPLYTPKGTIVKDELQKEVEKICRRYGFQKVSCPSEQLGFSSELVKYTFKRLLLLNSYPVSLSTIASFIWATA